MKDMNQTNKKSKRISTKTLTKVFAIVMLLLIGGTIIIQAYLSIQSFL